MQTLASLAVSMGVVLTAAGIGRSLRTLGEKQVSRFARNDGDCCAGPAERLVVDTSLGLGFVSLTIFLLSALQLLRPVPGVVLTVLLVAAAIPGLIGLWRDAIDIARRALRPSSLSSCLCAELLLVLAIAALIPALAPPTMGDWDSLAYHLAVPKLYIEHGGFYYIPYVTHSNFPYLVEMLYMPGLALGDPVSAKLIHYWFGVLLVGAVVVLTRRHVSPKAAPIAAVGIAGMPVVLWEATTAYVDLATALYTVVSVHLLLNYLDTRQGSGHVDKLQLAACGCAAGFAASTKMTGLSLIPMLAVWIVAVLGFRSWWQACKLCLIAAVVCLPWYLKSVIYTGSPVYPFFYSLFGGRDWSAQLASNYTMLQKQFGMGHSPGAFLLLPFNLTFHSEAFYDRPGLYVGPLLLVSLPILTFARYRCAKLTALLVFFIAQLALWFALSQQSRYLIPAFAVLAVLVAGLTNLDERMRRTRALLGATLAATAVFGLVVMLWPEMRETTRVVFGAESRETYLIRRLDIYPAQTYINTMLPSESKIALFGDTRGFYLERPYAWADWGHNVMFSRDFDSAKSLRDFLKSNGFTHALVNFGIAFPERHKATGTALRVYEAIESGNFEHTYPVTPRGSVAVYRIR